MDQAEWKLLKEIAELEKTPQGAYNIRRNGALDSRNSTANIEITTKTEPGKSGIDIRIKPGTRHESVHIPVIISQTGLSEMVYNDFFIGEDCDVDIVAGCGIHNTGCETSQHDGVHTFYVGKNSKVRYVERHYGEGPGTGKRIMNPQTVVYLEEGATINLESTQIRGVDSTKRETKIVVGKDAEAIITEKLLTHGAMPVAALTSQVISNVPAAILLSRFTDDYRGLLVGVNIGGAGTLVASLASLITFREYTKHVKGQTGRFMVLFSAISFGFLGVLLVAMTLWMR